jgi:hypothetical protein
MPRKGIGVLRLATQIAQIRMVRDDGVRSTLAARSG